MTEYFYNTKIPLIKATRLINSKIIVSLASIWVALLMSSFFLLNKEKAAGLLPNVDMAFIPAAQEKQNADGAFVLVVRNKKMTLTRYTAYIDSADAVMPNENIVAADGGKNETAVVRQPKTNKPKNVNDFSIKNVPQ